MCNVTTNLDCNHTHNYDETMSKYWDEFCATVHTTFADAALKKAQLFIAKNDNRNQSVFDIFMSYIPNEHKQHYNCNSCKSFLNRFGYLCYVDDDGHLVSAIFKKGSVDSENPFLAFAARMEFDIRDGSFYHVTRALGQDTIAANNFIFGNNNVDEVRGFKHLWVNIPAGVTGMQVATTNEGDMMHKSFMERIATISDKTIDIVDNAIRENLLYRGDKYKEIIDFLKTYRVKLAACKGDRCRTINLGWKYTFLGGNGFWNFGNTTIGELMSNIESGMDLDTAIAKYNDMMNPTKYMRPTREVSNSFLDRASELFEEKHISYGSLERRYASFNEVKDKAIWVPQIKKENNSDNPFEAMKKPVERIQTDRKISSVKSISIGGFIEKLKEGNILSIRAVETANSSFFAFTAPAREDNDPLLYYDKEDNRNPYGWFTSNAPLNADYKKPVIGVIPFPNMWNKDIPNRQGFGGYLFVLKDFNFRVTVSNCLFPELLRSDLFEIRPVIENYNRIHTLGTIEEQVAGGIGFTVHKSGGSMLFDVEYENFITRYKVIDIDA